MTVGELKKKLEKYEDKDPISVRCYIDDEPWTGCVSDVYKNIVEPWMPVIIQIFADYYPSIEHRFQTLGRIVEDAIDKNYNLAIGKDND